MNCSVKAKIIFNCLALAIAGAIITGCGTSKRAGHAYHNSSPSAQTGIDGFAGNANTDKADDWSTKNSETPERKIIYDADITIVVKKPDTVNLYIAKIAGKYNGYVLNSASLYTTIRVKADSLQLALTEIAALGKVKNKNIFAEDITEQFADLGIRLENAQKARARYLELLAKAATVEEILKVEKELERLNTEIELLEGKINRLKHLEEFSTITVTINKKIKPGPLGIVFKYLFKGVKVLFIWSD